MAKKQRTQSRRRWLPSLDPSIVGDELCPRYVAMCIPGRQEDGADSSWFVLDRHTWESTPIGDGDHMRKIAYRAARHANMKADR